MICANFWENFLFFFVITCSREAIITTGHAERDGYAGRDAAKIGGWKLCGMEEHEVDTSLSRRRGDAQ